MFTFWTTKAPSFIGPRFRDRYNSTSIRNAANCNNWPYKGFKILLLTVAVNNCAKGARWRSRLATPQSCNARYHFPARLCPPSRATLHGVKSTTPSRSTDKSKSGPDEGWHGQAWAHWESKRKGKVAVGEGFLLPERTKLSSNHFEASLPSSDLNPPARGDAADHLHNNATNAVVENAGKGGSSRLWRRRRPHWPTST